MLLIAASCLIPVALETLSAANMILKVGAVAAALFGLFGALGTLAALSEELVILRSTFNLLPFLFTAAATFMGSYDSSTKLRRVTLHSQVNPTSQLTKTVVRPRSPLHHWHRIEHFTQAPPAWSSIRHFFINSRP